MSNFGLSNNYYSSRIKEGIPIFQEINGGNLINNYTDPFKALEQNKIETFINGSNNMNNTDFQTRRMLEQEMKPYLTHMKNELNMIIDKFRKEMNNKNNFNDILDIKQELSNNKSNFESNFIILEKKIFDINDALNNQQKRINDLQNEIGQINYIKNKNDDIIIKKEIENIKNKINILDISNEKNYKEVSNNLSKILNYKLDNFNQNINFIKEENDSIKSDLTKQIIKIESLNSEIEKKDSAINEIKSEMINLPNKINNIKIENNKLFNLINNIEITNNELQGKLKSLNDKIFSINDNLGIINLESKNQKEKINLNNKYLSELENNISILDNEKSVINNKLNEIFVKLEYQEEKLSKNNNLNQNDANNLLYKDLSTQIAKTKNIMDDMREKYEKDMIEIKNNLNLFEQIIKNNPFLNMNESDRLSILFKNEQIKTNDTFKEQIKLLNEEIKKLRKNSQYDKNNFEIINNNFKKQAQNINMLEQTFKSWTQIAQILTEKYEKLKKDKGDDKISINTNLNNINLDDNINEVKKYINNNRKNIDNLQLDIKDINEKKIPDIYKFINDQLKNNIGVKLNENYNINNIKNDIKNIPNNNIMNNNNEMKKTSNGGNIYNNKNLDEIASKIELMGSAAQAINPKFNDNKKSKMKDFKYGANSSFSHSLSENLDKKDGLDIESINEIMDEDKNDTNLKKNDFDFDFDN